MNRSFSADCPGCTRQVIGRHRYIQIQSQTTFTGRTFVCNCATILIGSAFERNLVARNGQINRNGCCNLTGDNTRNTDSRSILTAGHHTGQRRKIQHTGNSQGSLRTVIGIGSKHYLFSQNRLTAIGQHQSTGICIGCLSYRTNHNFIICRVIVITTGGKETSAS